LFCDYAETQKRFLDSLAAHVPANTPMSFYWNCAPEGDKAREVTTRIRSFGEATLRLNPVNVGKYAAMRELFACVPDGAPADWFLWFDDDSHIVRPEFWEYNLHFLKSNPKAEYMGQPVTWEPTPEQRPVIEARPWFRPELGLRPVITAAHGAGFWIKRELVERLNWPDPMLRHNGADTLAGIEGDLLLGEAARHAGAEFVNYGWGAALSDGPRRGIGGVGKCCGGK
jgi:hypothetical protein